MNDCPCVGVGYCAEYRRVMSPRMLEICRGEAAGLTAAECAAYRGTWRKLANKKLLGNRIEAALAAIGVPSCEGCKKRRDWLNGLPGVFSRRLAAQNTQRAAK